MQMAKGLIAVAKIEASFTQITRDASQLPLLETVSA